ncbi:MAG: protein kinase [Gemmataceae bacterium]|nr:protein kinase [Gemmataceae bacterium]
MVLGPYTILDRLGEGGSGQVFKARHRAMNRLVALKLLRADVLADAEVVARFYREIEVASQISHPNIVHALDAGPINNRLVLAMELVDGVSLDRLVKDSGPLPSAAACDYIRQAALGLQHAHERGLVHRDIKPSNLLLKRAAGNGSSVYQAGPWGLVKILDFGLARLLHPAAASPTKHLTQLAGNSVMQGTPDFMAPEQAIDFHRANIRADIYGLGCTFYYLLTGQPPFAGATLTEKLMKQQTVMPRPIGEFRNDVRASAVQVLDKMLAKRPGDRYQTPSEVAAALTLDLPETRGEHPSRLRGGLASLAQRFLANGGPRLGRLSLSAGLMVLVFGGLAVLFRPGTPSGGTNLVKEPVSVSKPRMDPATAIKDPGFETPSVGVGFHDAFSAIAKGSPWTFSGTAGVAGNASGYTAGNPNAPQGTQVAFLQGTKSMSQSMTLSAGTYQLEFLAAQRKNTQGGGQTFRVLIDGSVMGTFTPGSTQYARNATSPFTVNEGTHNIAFQALNPRGGDNTVFIDVVQVILPGSTKTLPGWTIVDSSSAKSTGGATLTRQPDGSLLVGGPNVACDQYHLTFTTQLTGITAARLDVLPDPSLPALGPGRAGNGNFVLSQIRVTALARGDESNTRPVVLSKAMADYARQAHSVASTIDGGNNDWAILPHIGNPHVAVFELKEPLGHPDGTTLQFHLRTCDAVA